MPKVNLIRQHQECIRRRDECPSPGGKLCCCTCGELKGYWGVRHDYPEGFYPEGFYLECATMPERSLLRPHPPQFVWETYWLNENNMDWKLLDTETDD